MVRRMCLPLTHHCCCNDDLCTVQHPALSGAAQDKPLNSTAKMGLCCAAAPSGSCCFCTELGQCCCSRAWCCARALQNRTCLRSNCCAHPLSIRSPPQAQWRHQSAAYRQRQHKLSSRSPFQRQHPNFFTQAAAAPAVAYILLIG